jgi:hypothetical protein
MARPALGRVGLSHADGEKPVWGARAGRLLPWVCCPIDRIIEAASALEGASGVNEAMRRPGWQAKVRCCRSPDIPSLKPPARLGPVDPGLGTASQAYDHLRWAAGRLEEARSINLHSIL